MKHFVLGYPYKSRKGAVTVLYAGDSRLAARDALFAGGEGIVLTDYICNPQISQSRRHTGALAEVQWAPAEIPAEAEPPAPAKKADKPKPLALPSKHTPAEDTPES